MAICDRCSAAIQELRPQDWQVAQKRARRISVKLPRYRRSSIFGCWVCCKFSHWLAAENPGLLQAWHWKSLRVEFSSFGRIHIEPPEQGHVLSLFAIEILPLDHNGDGGGCEVELNFITAQGRANLFPIKLIFPIRHGI
jgi:hypothetical protein